MTHAVKTKAAPPGGRRRRRARALLVLIPVLMIAVVGASALGFFALSAALDDNVARVPDAFVGLDPGHRPPPQTAMTFLLVGIDSRMPDPATGTDVGAAAPAPGGPRGDTLLLAQLDAGRTRATVVSVPRDAWVDIPGHGRGKINSAYALGGPALLVQTVEALTTVHIDHFAVIDFSGFRSVVDALGGVDVQVAATTSSGGVRFAQGIDHLDGEQALAYVRQRYGLPDGDLSRVRRQQNLLRAVLDRLAAGDSLAHPFQLFTVLDAATRSVSVDATLTKSGLLALAFDLRKVQVSTTTFLTVPLAGSGRQGAADVLYLDTARATQLWEALRGGDPREYARQHPTDLLGDAPS